MSRVNAVDNCSAIGQTNATRGACSQRAANNFHTSATRAVCGQRATNDFHISVVRGVREAGSRRVMSDRVFHTSTAARDHTAACRPSSGDHDSVTYGSDRVSQSTTMPIVTISDQSVQTDRPNSQTEFNSAVSN